MKRSGLIALVLFLAAPLALDAAEPKSAKEPGEVTFTCPAKFQKQGQNTQLILEEKGGETHSIYWSSGDEWTSLPVKLKEGEEYTFTLTEAAKGEFPEIIRVERDGKTLYDRTVCEVHQVPMKYTKVPVSYGIVAGAPGDPPWDVMQKQFPHWREIVYGGCVIGPNSPKDEYIYVCPECKTSVAKWKSAQK